jgi:hypothetical protein
VVDASGVVTTVKIAIPAANTTLRPNTSASDLAINNNAAKSGRAG